MKILSRILLLTLVLSMGSCGVITKARYGNGFKLNLEWNGKDRNNETEPRKKRERKKERKDQNIPAISQEESLNEPLTYNNIESVPENDDIVDDNSVKKHKKTSARIKKIAAKISNKYRIPEIKNTINEPGAPIEGTTLVGGILFYTGLLGSIALSLSQSFLAPEISVFLFLALLAGFVLSIIGYRRIRQSGGYFSGAGLALSVIIIGCIYLLFVIVLILAILAFFAVL